MRVSGFSEIITKKKLMELIPNKLKHESETVILILESNVIAV